MSLIKQIISIILWAVSLGYGSYAFYVLNSLPDQIAESKSAPEKNKLLREVRDAYSTKP
jgi:hypothetical protein